MRYVAVGDSFTEGVGDEPFGDEVPRGWADLVAAGLTAKHDAVEYANLAVRGRLLEPIATDQIDAALALAPAPTMMTFNGGGNDTLRPGIEPQRLLDMIRTAVRRSRDAGIHVVVLAGPDPSGGLPFGDTIRRRCAYLTDEVGVIAADEEVDFVDVFHDEEIRHPGYWSADRLHLNEIGHRRVAGLVLAALSIDDPSLTTATPMGPHPERTLYDEVRFYRDHFAPWLGRRLRRGTSRDDRSAKHPAWVTLHPSPR